MGTVAAWGGVFLAAGWRSPTGHLKLDQWHALLLAACWVIGWTWSQPVTARARWGRVAAWAVPVALIYRDGPGIAWLWLATWWLVWLAAERLAAHPAAVRQAVRGVAWWHVALMVLSWLGWTGYEQAGGGFAGSLGRRSVCSALFGLCVAWSTGAGTWFWTVLAGLTTGTVGVGIGLAVLTARWRRRGWLLPLWAGLAWYAWPRLGIRWSLWERLWPRVWPPVGFAAFRGGFIGDGLVDRLLSWYDYHSAVVEAVGRWGYWPLLLAGLVWLAVQDRLTWPTGLWIVVVLCTQSLEATPVLGWFVVLALIGGTRHVDSLQTARRPA